MFRSGLVTQMTAFVKAHRRVHLRFVHFTQQTLPEKEKNYKQM